MKNQIILSSIVTLMLISCAKRPDSIVATTIPASAYDSQTCSQLASGLVQEKENLAALSKAQNKAATADAVGVFLVGVPAGSLTGQDKEGTISVSKGKIIAIESTMKSKKC